MQAVDFGWTAREGSTCWKRVKTAMRAVQASKRGTFALNSRRIFFGVWRGSTTVGGGGQAGRRAAGIAGGGSRSCHCFCCLLENLM